ncbi:polysaccharide deacetylase family protein [Xanthobacter autotrophicus]|uniref:polysaccharide deacetylase family protein n=1 Tax=Xanthobacter TaxID=279 RepID=UPI0024AA9E9F|nr:polysaccharide deacetylase family protein [Xanthobacter autotrophicus]MDI4665433.1 polysaccharide deacetylase family protein [Xanthobacter autotrophicus]
MSVRSAFCLALLLLPLSVPVLAGPAAGPACFAPAALAARPGEEIVRPRAGGPVNLPDMAAPSLPPVPAALRGSIRRVDLPAGQKLVALTFDLCEASGEISGYDGAIVDYLRAEGVAATFFAGGKWLMSHAERGDQLTADPQFEMGNHTWSHANLTVRTGDAMRRQVDDADIALALRRSEVQARGCMLPSASAQGTGGGALFRFPYGSCSAESLNYVNDSGHLAIQWDVDSGDPAFIGAKGMAEDMLRGIRPGSIVLMHANGRGKHTAEALKILIPALRAKGYRFATVGQLLAAGRPVIADTCYSLKPGDTRVYDDAARGGKRILPAQ